MDRPPHELSILSCFVGLLLIVCKIFLVADVAAKTYCYPVFIIPAESNGFTPSVTKTTNFDSAIMKISLLLVWFITLHNGMGQAEQLPKDQLEAIIKRLNALQEASDSRVEARFRTAVQAFRSAMSNEESAFTLYLNCVEKLDFTDKNRRASDFRDWRKNQDHQHKDAAFRKALRYQLRWLVLSLQASSDHPNPAELAKNAQDVVDAIAADASNLAGQNQILNQSVGGSYFARAYQIDNLKTDDWVMAPGNIGRIYEQIILPQHRIKSSADELRTLWTKRIQQEIRIAEAWRFGVKSSTTGGQPVAKRGFEHENFFNEEVPKLQWQMEVDLFKHGDPLGAAQRMITQLEKNMTHPSAAEWLSELKNLLKTPRKHPISDPACHETSCRHRVDSRRMHD